MPLDEKVIKIEMGVPEHIMKIIRDQEYHCRVPECNAPITRYVFSSRIDVAS